jgi:hypothetical protein
LAGFPACSFFIFDKLARIGRPTDFKEFSGQYGAVWIEERTLDDLQVVPAGQLLFSGYAGISNLPVPVFAKCS